MPSTSPSARPGWALVRFLFKLDFYLPGAALFVFWLATALLTTAIGLATTS